MSNRHSYHEALLHWIWKERQFDPRGLATADGDTVQIHEPGAPNPTDGPDFTAAELTIGNLRWYGDVEIHWRIGDWRSHGHHRNSNFDNVILHVVFEETTENIQRSDGGSIPTLCLKPALSQPLDHFLGQFREGSAIPCAGSLSYISEEAFARQLQKAHKEYFEEKVDKLLDHYDPSLPPSAAWKKLFSIAFADGLGIAHNRSQMQTLAKALITQIPEADSKQTLRSTATRLSGLNSTKDSSINISWNHKGCRPGNHPKHRIRQAADALWFIHQEPSERWITTKIDKQWENFLDAISTSPSIGRERGSILFGTVFLPAMYCLGNLFHASKLKSQSWELWQQHQAQIPNSLLKQLHQTNLPPSLYRKKLGTVYQLREYCQPHNCQHCKVFKNAISS